MTVTNLQPDSPSVKHFHTTNYIAEAATSQHDSISEDNEKAINTRNDALPIEPEEPIIPSLDWDDENDPANPFNWPMWKRICGTMVPGLLGLAVTFGSSVYTPGYPEVARDFGISSTAALLPLSVWTLGLGFGYEKTKRRVTHYRSQADRYTRPMIGAPISEMFGRKVVYMLSTPISLLFTMGAGLSPTFAGLVACRFLGGVFGSPVKFCR